MSLVTAQGRWTFRGASGPIAAGFAAAPVFDGSGGDEGRDGAFDAGPARLESGTEEGDAASGVVRDEPEDRVVYSLVYSLNRLKRGVVESVTGLRAAPPGNNGARCGEFGKVAASSS